MRSLLASYDLTYGREHAAETTSVVAYVDEIRMVDEYGPHGGDDSAWALKVVPALTVREAGQR